MINHSLAWYRQSHKLVLISGPNQELPQKRCSKFLGSGLL